MTSIHDQALTPPPKRNKICDPVPGDTGTNVNVSRSDTLTEQCFLHKRTNPRLTPMRDGEGAAANVVTDTIEELRQYLILQNDQAEELRLAEHKAHQIEVARMEKKLEESMTVNSQLEQSMRMVRESLAEVESENIALKNENKEYLDANGEMWAQQTAAQIEDRQVRRQLNDLTEMKAVYEAMISRRAVLIESLQSENEQLVKDKEAYKVKIDDMEDQVVSMEAAFLGEMKAILHVSQDAPFETLKRLSVPCSVTAVVETRTESDLRYSACLVRGQRLVLLNGANQVLCCVVEVLLYIDQGTDDSYWINILGNIWATLEASDGFTTKDRTLSVAPLMHMIKVIIIELSPRQLSDMALWLTCQIHCRVMQWLINPCVNQDLLNFSVKAFDLKDRLLISTGIAQIMAASSDSQGPSENTSRSETLHRIASRLPDQAKVLTCLYAGENIKVCLYPLPQDTFISLTWGNGQFAVWHDLTANCRFFVWKWEVWLRLEKGIADSPCCLRVIHNNKGLGGWLYSHSITFIPMKPEDVNS